jgi:PAS domain S-box-containing protein
MGALVDNFSRMSRAVLEREQALRGERDLVLSILESSADAILIAELDGTLTECNSAAVEIFAASKPENLIGRNYYDLILLEDFALARQGERILQISGALRDTEYRFKALDERIFPGGVSIGIIRDGSGRGTGFVATVRDITGRKLAEEELRQSEEKFRTFMEQSSDGIILVDEQGIIIELNQSFQRMSGVRREAVLGRPAWEALTQFAAPESNTPERMEALRQMVLTAIQDGVSPILYRTLDAQIRQADGSQRIIQQILFPIRTRGGYRLGATFRDITERRQMEERLQASLAEKDVLLREVHHRVKNNFGVIISLLGLQSRYIQDEATQTLFAELQERIRSMSLIHEKLYQSRELARVDFASYVREMVNGLGQMFGARSAAIRLTVDVEDVVLGVDTAIPCGLMINELVTNALKYAFPNGSSGEVRVSFRPEGENWVLSVSDNGAGLPPEHADLGSPHSFGLRLIRILTEQLEGTLEVDLSSGTAYTIRFRQEG